MLGKLARLFGLGGGQPVASSEQGGSPTPAALASALANDPRKVDDVARRLAPSELPAVLAALPADKGTVAAELTAKLLAERDASPDILRQIAAQLSPAAREQVLAALPAATRAKAASSGFDVVGQLDVTSTTAADRARVSAGPLPPSLVEFAQANDLVRRIADVRAGRSAVTLAERSELREALSDLDQSQLKALRELLVERPPHPRLREMRDHPALRGPPTAAGVLAILVGEPLGLTPRPSPELVKAAKLALGEYPHGFTPDVERQWVELLAQSPMAIRLVRNNGPLGLDAVRAIGVEGLEAAGNPWFEGSTLMRLGTIVPGKFGELREFLDAQGPEAFRQALRDLGAVRQAHGIVDRVAERDGFVAAARLARAGAADAHGLRCFMFERGDDEASALAQLRGKSTAALARTFADSGSRIAEFGSGSAPLYTGAHWPAARPRTASIQQAEQRVLSAVGLPANALGAGRARLSEGQVGALSRALQGEVAQRSPELSSMLERELLGRRFINRQYYDALYAQGVRNPEHRYSVDTFESWRSAESFVRAQAAASAGRPLQAGELTAVMQAAHRAAGQGMVGKLDQSHLKADDLGRLRSAAADHVQLGNAFHEVDRETAAKLDRNPYLQPNALARAPSTGESVVHRPIMFSAGVDVPRLVGELDAWVRANEGVRSPSELAAEVHFRLVSIHPFMDGNGRTSKLMADFVLLRAGVEPPVWQKGDVLKNVDVWPAAVREGVDAQLDIVKRYFDAAVDARSTRLSRDSGAR